MILLTIFGAGMFILGTVMLLKPLTFSNGIAAFSRKVWFHSFEVTSRLVVGLLFMLCADSSAYPRLVMALGGLLCFVAVFLIIIGAERHKRFALLTANIGNKFRPLGVVAQVCGIALVWVGAA